jgi:pimeloyl-ACP methyl ester carboxylesterase
VRSGYVVLLHGIARGKGAMAKMEKALEQEGYIVLNIDYPSRKKPIEDLVADIRHVIEAARIPASKKLDFVGHSMGGLIIRAYIYKYKPENLGRVVMLGTPNQGSEVADFLADNFLYKRYYGPAGQQLITDQNRFEKIFGAIDYDLGVIAGDWSLDPISSLLIIPGKNDGKVAVARTKIKGMKDHIILHATHTFMPSNPGVIRQTAHFLKQGKFLQ